MRARGLSDLRVRYNHHVGTDGGRVLGATLTAILAMALGILVFRGPAAAGGSVEGSSPAVGTAAPVGIDLGIERVSPRPDAYGVGIVVRILFDHKVPRAARTAVTDRISVTSSKPIGESGWAWTDARTAVFRPKGFWPANTTVTISTRPGGELITQGPGSGLRWAGSAEQTFTTGAAQVITVDALTDQATVVRDGQAVRTMPVSLGKSGWETRSGIKVLMEKYEVKRMTSASIGAEDPYILDAPDAIRLTDSGEFIHAAPWANARLGRSNGSHGCTNVSSADARWLYVNHLYGDPVITTGTSRPMEADNGAGGVWNVPWATWLTGQTR